jgi:hypothetical protein
MNPLTHALRIFLVFGLAVSLDSISNASHACMTKTRFDVASYRQAESVVRARILNYRPPREYVCQVRYALTRNLNDILNCQKLSRDVPILERARDNKAEFEFEVIETLKGEHRHRWNLYWTNSTFGYPGYWNQPRDVIFGVVNGGNGDGSPELVVMQTGCTDRSILDDTPANLMKVRKALKE